MRDKDLELTSTTCTLNKFLFIFKMQFYWLCDFSFKWGSFKAGCLQMLKWKTSKLCGSALATNGSVGFPGVILCQNSHDACFYIPVTHFSYKDRPFLLTLVRHKSDCRANTFVKFFKKQQCKYDLLGSIVLNYMLRSQEYGGVTHTVDEMWQMKQKMISLNLMHPPSEQHLSVIYLRS